MHPRRRHGRAARPSTSRKPDQPRARRRPGFRVPGRVRGGPADGTRVARCGPGSSRRVAPRSVAAERRSRRGGVPPGTPPDTRAFRADAAPRPPAAPPRRDAAATTPRRLRAPPCHPCRSCRLSNTRLCRCRGGCRGGAARRAARGAGGRGTRVQRAIVRGACVSATPTPPGRMCADSEITTISYGRLYSPPLHSTRQVGSS